MLAKYSYCFYSFKNTSILNALLTVYLGGLFISVYKKFIDLLYSCIIFHQYFFLLIPYQCMVFPVLQLQTTVGNKLVHLSLCTYVKVSGRKNIKIIAGLKKMEYFILIDVSKVPIYTPNLYPRTFLKVSEMQMWCLILELRRRGGGEWCWGIQYLPQHLMWCLQPLESNKNCQVLSMTEYECYGGFRVHPLRWGRNAH